MASRLLGGTAFKLSRVTQDKFSRTHVGADLFCDVGAFDSPILL